MQACGAKEWALPEGFRVQFEGLAGELYIGGVYVRLFLKNPSFPLRNPKAFLEGLLEAFTAELTARRSADQVRVSRWSSHYSALGGFGESLLQSFPKTKSAFKELG